MSLTVSLTKKELVEVFDLNITSNLCEMAEAAGIYKHLWRPEELKITKAKQLIKPLKKALKLLKSDPVRFKKFNPPFGWGTYEDLVRFVDMYLAACIVYKNAKVEASR